MIAARLMQGAAGVLTWVAGLAVMADTIGQAHIGEYMGYVGIALNLSTFSAPLLGGFAFHHFGYDAVFGLTLVVLAIDLLLRLAMIERGDAAKWMVDARYEDSAVVDEDEDCDSDLSASSSSSSTDSSNFCKDDDGSESMPSTTWTLLTSPRLLVAFWGIFVQASLSSGFDAVLALHVKTIFGWNSLGTGLIYLPLTIPSFLGPLIGRLADRSGARWPATIGFLLSCPALVLLQLIDHDGAGQQIRLCALLAFIGLCITLTLNPLMSEVTYVVSYMEETGQIVAGPGGGGAYAQAYGLFSVAWSMGN